MRDGNALEDFLGEEVVDMGGNPVGTFACFWEREEKNALLLGVDIPERSGHTHLVPARGSRFNERQTYVQVAFTKEKIIQAPCLECGCEMDEKLEERIWAFYELPAPYPGASDPLAQKVEAIRRQLRRIGRCDPPPRALSPPASTTTAPAADPPAPGQEIPPAAGSPRPAEASPGEAQASKTQDASPDGLVR